MTVLVQEIPSKMHAFGSGVFNQKTDPYFHSTYFQPLQRYIQSQVSSKEIQNPSVITLLDRNQLDKLRKLVDFSDYLQAACYFINVVTLPKASCFIVLVIDKAIVGFSIEQKAKFCQELASTCFDKQMHDLTDAAVHVGLKFQPKPGVLGHLYYVKGFRLLELSDLVEGAKMLSESYELLKDNHSGDFKLCKLCYAWAKSLLLQYRYSEAKSVLLKLKGCKLDLDDPVQAVVTTRLRYLLAKCFEADGVYIKVFQVLKDGFDGVPLLSEIEQIEYHNLFGEAAMLFGDVGTAVGCFQNSLKANQTQTAARRSTELLLGDALIANKEYCLAVSTLREHIAYEPSLKVGAMIDQAMRSQLTQVLYD